MSSRAPFVHGFSDLPAAFRTMTRYRDGGWWGVVVGAELPSSMAVETFQQPAGPWWCIDWGYMFFWISVNVQVATLSSWAAEEEENKTVLCPDPGLWLSRRIKTRIATLCHHKQPLHLCSTLSQPHAKAANAMSPRTQPPPPNPLWHGPPPELCPLWYGHYVPTTGDRFSFGTSPQLP